MNLGSYLTLILLWAATGCKQGETPRATGTGSVATGLVAAVEFEKAQAKLPAMQLWVGAKPVTAELARSMEEIRRGLMFRTEMGEDEGMLFVFAQPHQASFYMRNTVLPLTCAYIASNGEILEIHDMEPLEETPITASSDRIQYVLEMNRDWFKRNGVQKGAVVRTEHGSLRETFFAR
jgi:uncharacterized protein